MHGLSRVEYEIRDGTMVFADSGPVRAMVTEAQLGPASEPTLHDLSEALVDVYGTDYGVHSPDLDLAVHRCHPAGRGLPQGAGAARR